MKIWKLLSNYVEAVPKLAAISDKSKSAGSIRRGERDRQDSSWKESINENRSHTRILEPTKSVYLSQVFQAAFWII
jgi:hypothetical protein